MTINEARVQLRALVRPVLARLEDIVNDPDEESMTVIRAAREILDRAGLKPTDRIELSGVMGVLRQDDLRKLNDDELGTIINAARLLTGLRAGGEETETVEVEPVLSG